MKDVIVFVRTDSSLQRGDEVLTPGGAGRVLSVRMAAPDFNSPEAVSVLLDARQYRAGYRGTVYPFDEVQRLVN